MKPRQYKGPKYHFSLYCKGSLPFIVMALFLPHAFSAPTDTSEMQALPVTVINLEQCRLANYIVEFDIKRGSSNVGNAVRGLKTAEQGKDMILFSSLKASMAFLTFSQQERSVIAHYENVGFYSSEYTKQVKKSFRRATDENYVINPIEGEHPADLFDPLSVYDHLRELSCSGLRSNLTLNVKDENEIRPHYFEYQGEQILELPIGTTETLLFVRTRKTSSRETSIWFSINDHFLPVKIEQEKEGDTQGVLIATSITFTK